MPACAAPLRCFHGLAARSHAAPADDTQRGVRSDRIVVAPPYLDQHLCLVERAEQLGIQQFVAELRARQ